MLRDQALYEWSVPPAGGKLAASLRNGKLYRSETSSFAPLAQAKLIRPNGICSFTVVSHFSQMRESNIASV